MSLRLKSRVRIASIAGVLVPVVIAGCTDLPTGTPTINVLPSSPPMLASFSNTGSMYFDSGSDCAFNSTSGNIDCHLTLKGLAQGSDNFFSYHVDWDVSVYCMNGKTGKLAPSKLQPSSPHHTYTGGGIGVLRPDANGEYHFPDPYILYPPGLAPSYFCPQRPYDTAVFGTLRPTTWTLHAYQSGDESGNFADMWGTIP